MSGRRPTYPTEGQPRPDLHDVGSWGTVHDAIRENA